MHAFNYTRRVSQTSKRKYMKSATSLKALLALTALGSVGVSSAQNVTFYGTIDVGVENVTNVGASGSSLSRVPSNTNSIPSRLGVRGNVDIGDSNKVVYAAEAGFDPGNGNLNQGGRLLGRQAYVGLSGEYGTVSIGRQYTMVFWSMLDSDTFGGGIYGTGSLDSYIPNARADNALVWMGKFKGWTLGTQYSFGRDTVNAGPSPAGTNCPGESTDSEACRQWSAMAKYDTPSWGFAVAQDKMNGRNVGAAPDAIFGGLNTSAKTDTRQMLNGWVKVGTAKIGAGVVHRKNDGNTTVPESDLLYLGASAPLTPKFTLAAQLATLKYSANSDYNSTLMAVRGTYSLFKSTELYGQIGNIQNSAKSAVSVSGGASGSNPLAGGNQSAVDFGVRFSF